MIDILKMRSLLEQQSLDVETFHTALFELLSINQSKENELENRLKKLQSLKMEMVRSVIDKNTSKHIQKNDKRVKANSKKDEIKSVEILPNIIKVKYPYREETFCKYKMTSQNPGGRETLMKKEDSVSDMIEF